ncbi:MAG: DNA polymerase III subunit delta' [Ichthyobacteriaceae bacterium]|nr:DNA polymerase III subunit delta' [Ichthyobacteriaceae bacterium]
MLFDKIIGHEKNIQQLKNTVDNNKISHAQMFCGPKGSGMLQVAIAYAQYVLCNNNKLETCYNKVIDFNHPDLHFAFPVNTNGEVKTKPVSKDFIKQWYEFLNEDKFGEINNWLDKINVTNKDGLISVNEAVEIVKAMALKAYESNHKVMIIWMPELMNNATANKLLKLIEEPVGNTLFILVTEDEEKIISTIRSRTQIMHFKRLSDKEVSDYLITELNIDEQKALNLANIAFGNINEATNLLANDTEELEYQDLFVGWIRASFKADLKMLVNWADTMAKKGRKFQLGFLNFAIRVFRQALLENYSATDLSFLKIENQGFKFDNFVRFIHGQNIVDLFSELDKAIFHIERNANAKVVLLDVSIKVTRGLYTKYK